jgi:hypothetical protein
VRANCPGERRVSYRLSVIDSPAVTFDETDTDSANITRIEHEVRRLKPSVPTKPNSAVTRDADVTNVVVDQAS